jgi:hypothetical protein
MERHPDLKAIVEVSGTMLNWALLVAGASVAALVSTSYERPKTRGGRWFYVFFVPAWVFLGISLYIGLRVSRRYIAAIIPTKPNVLDSISNHVNEDFLHQWQSLLSGLGFLAVWLVLFLSWFMWFAPESTSAQNSGSLTDAHKATAERAADKAAAESVPAEKAAERAATATEDAVKKSAPIDSEK